jgi:glycosyltransferase involved in cell wall biosynthesis
MKLSIIIPTLNEGRYLAAAVAGARRRAVAGAPHEIIVSDCGSVDGTAELAARLGVRGVQAEPRPDSRAAALNAGAARATGDVFLFLDADSTVPPGYDRAIGRALRDPGVVGGAFEFALHPWGLGIRLVEVINRIRYRIWPLYYGDQGIFVRAAVFRRVGGYPPRRILEASDFCRALWREGRLVLLRQRMTTSSRRFLEGGVIRVLAHDVRLWWLDLRGHPTEPFAAAYQENNRRRGFTPGPCPDPAPAGSL